MKKLKLIKGLAIALAASIFMTGTPVNASETLGDDCKPLVTIDDPNTYEIKGLEVSSKNDYLDVKVNVEYGTCYTEVCYSLFAYDYTTNSWSMVGGWQKDTNFKWKPDSNDRYALALYSADKHFDSYENSKGERKDINIRYVNTKSYWQEVNRPQMSKKVINDCAINTGDGLLFGCTSNVTKADKDYFTTCYIYSYADNAWIAQAAYQASDCAWFKVSSLKPGTYMMYTCTEKANPDGSRRKLSCKYYNFNLQ